jgi:hypothetical protein
LFKDQRNCGFSGCLLHVQAQLLHLYVMHEIWQIDFQSTASTHRSFSTPRTMGPPRPPPSPWRRCSSTPATRATLRLALPTPNASFTTTRPSGSDPISLARVRPQHNYSSEIDLSYFRLLSSHKVQRARRDRQRRRGPKVPDLRLSNLLQVSGWVRVGWPAAPLLSGRWFLEPPHFARLCS